MRSFNFLFVCLLTQADVFGQTYLGTKTPYAPSHAAYTAPPAGYQPVFIDYVGRHGARFLTKAGADQQVLEALQAAERSNALTDMGKKIKAIAQRLQAAGKGNYENITLLGQEEQEAIGERMRYNYENVFSGRGVEVVTTWKARTQQSAEAFLKGLAGYEGKKKYEHAPDSMDTTLRFYDLSPAYTHYKKGGLIKNCLDSLNKDGKTLATARRICGRVFTPAYAKELMKTTGAAGKTGTVRGVAFADDLYDLYSIAWSMSGELRAAGHPEDSEGLGIAFDRDDLEWMDFRNGAADFLEKGPGFDSVGIQVKVAAPLLADLINSLDRAITRPDGNDAVLRFTHAEAIAPLAALLDIREASTPVTSIYKYHDHWDAGKVIPLSANIQWVLYTGSGGYLVKVLLNEREAVLPVRTSQWPYYRWEDLRAYYVQKLGAVGAGLQQDMLGYLKGLE
ncbi:MAG TPA: histidine-type phosphatase [Puia sp.]|nr:histidine-type phosphatase [Puia sp.]